MIHVRSPREASQRLVVAAIAGLEMVLADQRCIDQLPQQGTHPLGRTAKDLAQLFLGEIAEVVLGVGLGCRAVLPGQGLVALGVKAPGIGGDDVIQPEGGVADVGGERLQTCAVVASRGRRR
jgi:hypothetical protein